MRAASASLSPTHMPCSHCRHASHSTINSGRFASYGRRQMQYNSVDDICTSPCTLALVSAPATSDPGSPLTVAIAAAAIIDWRQTGRSAAASTSTKPANRNVPQKSQADPYAGAHAEVRRCDWLKWLRAGALTSSLPSIIAGRPLSAHVLSSLVAVAVRFCDPPTTLWWATCRHARSAFGQYSWYISRVRVKRASVFRQWLAWHCRGLSVAGVIRVGESARVAALID